MCLKLLWLRWAIRYVVDHPAPRRIPYGPIERTRERDYAYALIDDLEPETSILVEDSAEGKIIGRVWDGTEYSSTIASIPMRRAANAQPKFVYYWRDHDFSSSSAFRFCVGTWLRGYRISAWWSNARLLAYRRRQLIRQQRIDVLGVVAEATANPASEPVDAVKVLNLLYRSRDWIRHPQRDAVFDRTIAVLQALAAEGLVTDEVEGAGFRIHPSAWRVLDEYFTEERRHRDSQGLQRKLFWVAILSAVAAGVQAYAALRPQPEPHVSVVVQVPSDLDRQQESRH
ncbi:hypothetical protein [Burkholderia gladioli]|uniref:hypothetical protein n=1 Tax=Burkholderia gladioli TaxID=28095 RepID=UPI0030159620